MAALADFARRTQALHRGWDWRGVAVKDHFKQLLGAVHLGANVGCGARTNMTIGAGDMGMRRDIVGGKLGMHDMAGLPAEIRRIHVGHAAIARGADDDEVDDGGDDDEVDAVAEDRVGKVDFGIDVGQAIELAQVALTTPHSERDQ